MVSVPIPNFVIADMACMVQCTEKGGGHSSRAVLRITIRPSTACTLATGDPLRDGYHGGPTQFFRLRESENNQMENIIE